MAEATEKFEVRDHWTQALRFEAEITCSPDATLSVKLGLAVKWAVKSRANLTRANLSGANLSRAYLTRANLSGAYLTRANLSGANLSRAYLTGADLTGADLSGADLSGANLSGAYLTRANLSGANLSGANLSGADLSGADLSGANLTGADLTGAYLSGAYLTGADLTRANLTRANLSGANLTGANLSGANLSRAYLTGADLTGANLSRAYLTGADLTGANLSGANLSDRALRPFKADLFLTLSSLHAGALDAQHLVAKLRAGEVDGSSYGNRDTTCACLVGTIAQPRGVRGEDLDHDSDRPAERWFMMIKPGDKPNTLVDGKETGGRFASRIALGWVLDWCAAHGIDPDGAPVANAQVSA